MKLIRRRRGKEKILATTYHNYLGWGTTTNQVFLHFTQNTDDKLVKFEVVMSPADALEIASWVLGHAKVPEIVE